MVDHYVWDGDQIIGETRSTSLNSAYGGSGATQGAVLYVPSGRTDLPLAILRKNHPSVSFVVPHPDYRGTYYSGTDASGNLVSCTPYHSGCVNILWPGASRTTYGVDPTGDPGDWFGSMVSGQKDATGLMYKRNRYYDPNSGRFTQEDPIGIAGGLNLYGYAGSDPINESDPFGLCDDPNDPDCQDELPTLQVKVAHAQEFVVMVGDGFGFLYSSTLSGGETSHFLGFGLVEGAGGGYFQGATATSGRPSGFGVKAAWVSPLGPISKVASVTSTSKGVEGFTGAGVEGVRGGGAGIAGVFGVAWHDPKANTRGRRYMAQDATSVAWKPADKPKPILSGGGGT